MIKAKLKECSECHEMTYLWKSTPRLCKPCALKISSSKPRSSDDSSKPPKSYKSVPNRIKPVSDKKLLELKEYRKLRDGYLKANPVCEFVGCNSREVDLHHKKSRKYYLCDVDIFMSVCRTHHIWIHNFCKESYELGYLIKSI